MNKLEHNKNFPIQVPFMKISYKVSKFILYSKNKLDMIIIDYMLYLCQSPVV